MNPNTIIVVSGLPRSGTSMAMQMLQSAGLEIFADHRRKPDKDNPQGYLEFEKVKHLDEDNSWVGQAQGQVIKVVSPLLEYLPNDYNYKIIFMNRNLNEVLASQKKMMKRRGEKHNGSQTLQKVSDEEMKQTFENHLQKIKTFLENQPNIQILELKYNQVVSDPQSATEKISKFFNNELDIKKMTSVVNPKLYRNKAVSS
jgi:hypothetical protein